MNVGRLTTYLVEVHGQVLCWDLQDPGMGALKGGQLLLQTLQPRATCRKGRGPGNSSKCTGKEPGGIPTRTSVDCLPGGRFLLVLQMGN